MKTQGLTIPDTMEQFISLVPKIGNYNMIIDKQTGFCLAFNLPEHYKDYPGGKTYQTMTKKGYLGSVRTVGEGPTVTRYFFKNRVPYSKTEYVNFQQFRRYMYGD